MPGPPLPCRRSCASPCGWLHALPEVQSPKEPKTGLFWEQSRFEPFRCQGFFQNRSKTIAEQKTPSGLKCITWDPPTTTPTLRHCSPVRGSPLLLPLGGGAASLNTLESHPPLA
eukprot:EG_transcript_44436